MQYRIIVCVAAFVVLTIVRVSAASAATITFDDPAVTGLLTNTYVGVDGHVHRYSNPMTSFSLDGATFFTPDTFILRTTFDNRSPLPYSYDFIADNVLQVSGTGLDISFLSPVDTFSFGAALNATNSPSHMHVELFGSGNASLGVYSLLLDQTVLSLVGGTNSNSEGLFLAHSIGPITAARLMNIGDGSGNGSHLNWVIDNVGFQPASPVPEPTSLLLFGTGLSAAGIRRWWKANHKRT